MSAGTLLTPSKMSLRDKIITAYTQLGIDTPVPVSVAGGEENPAPIYERIYKAIAADPAAGRPILESIVGERARTSADRSAQPAKPAADAVFISYFAPHTRLALAALYPTDLELAAKLLVDTVSYYKRKAIVYRSNDESSDEATPYWYSVIAHCPDVYFRREFEWMYGCEQGAVLRALMTSIGVDAAEIGYAKLSPKLWDFYRSRKESA